MAWAPSTNNLTEGSSLEHIVTGVGGSITIMNDGGDGIGNIQISIYDNINVLQKTLFWGSGATSWFVLTGWKVVYFALSGLGASCVDGGKDGFRIDDNNSNEYVNTDQCVKLASPMPVIYLNSPIAKIYKTKSHISWSVSTQINNEKYIIEHGTDAKSYTEIGEIKGDGTSAHEKHYTYIHETPSIGINCYRIKQVDYDGKYSYSDLASVRYDGTEATSIYPNPATSKVTITTTAQATLQIIDVYGRVIRRQDLSEGQNTINLSELPTGILIFVVGDQRYKVLKK